MSIAKKLFWSFVAPTIYWSLYALFVVAAIALFSKSGVML